MSYIKVITPIIVALSFNINFSYAKKLEQIFDDWHVLTTGENEKKICYIVSIPKEEQGNYKKRSEPYLLVSLFNDREAEVSISSGYPYKGGSSVELDIDKKTYKLQKIQGELAWAKTSSKDKQIINSMISGSNLIAKGTSKIGSYSIDTYSLKGFTKAFNEMNNLCKKK